MEEYRLQASVQPDSPLRPACLESSTLLKCRDGSIRRGSAALAARLRPSCETNPNVILSYMVLSQMDFSLSLVRSPPLVVSRPANCTQLLRVVRRLVIVVEF
jgi:hypothetical protein